MTAVDEAATSPPHPSPWKRHVRSISSFILTTIQDRPLAAFSTAFALGIVIASTSGSVVIWPCIAILVVSLLLFLVKGNGRAVAVAALMCLSIACGGLRYASTRMVANNDIGRWAASSDEQGRAATIIGTVSTDPEAKPGRLSFVLTARSVESMEDRFEPASGQVYVTVRMPALGDRHLDYGDVVSLHGVLEEPKAHTNPGAFSFRDYLARRGIYCMLTVKRSAGVATIGHGGGNVVLTAAWRLRRAMVSTIDKHLPSTEAAILAGILIGRRAELPPDLSDDFVKTGTVHILSSAGLHVGIVLGCFWFLFNRLTMHRKVTAGSLIGLAVLYAVLCGGRPSVTRAVIMAVVYLGAILFEREEDIPTALGLAALIILIDTPYAVVEPGFALSFLTVTTLAVGMPVWDAVFRRRVDRLTWPSRARRLLLAAIDLAGLTLFAQLGSAPVVMAAYNETSISGIAANIVVVPTLFVVIPLGLLAVTCGQVPGLSTLLFKAVMPFLLWIELVVRRLGESASGSAPMSTPPVWVVVIYYVVLWGVIALVRRRLDAGTHPVNEVGHSSLATPPETGGRAGW